MLTATIRPRIASGMFIGETRVPKAFSPLKICPPLARAGNPAAQRRLTVLAVPSPACDGSLRRLE